tara:strand:+ start:265 stop:606 length:342 start_codon:yes stop_codon:yes gene_type:complete
MEKEKRPWGTYEVLLDAENCKVKRICVDPGHRLSYQYHLKRHETWAVIEGVGVVTLDDEENKIIEGNTIEIPPLMRHRIQNVGSEPLVFIEVQRGEYFGEDDIVRLEDDYRRV